MEKRVLENVPRWSGPSEDMSMSGSVGPRAIGIQASARHPPTDVGNGMGNQVTSRILFGRD